MALDWDKLRIILALSRCGTQSTAANVLGVDQSTVGRQLNAMEAELGSILFVRTYSGLSPTEAGRIAIEYAIEVETNIQKLEDELYQVNSKEGGPVSIIGNYWILEWLIEKHLSQFQSKSLDILLHFNASQRHWPLTKGDAELALWFEITPRDGEFSIPVGTVSYDVYAAKDKNPKTLPWISFRDPGADRAPWKWFSSKEKKDNSTIFATASDAKLVQTNLTSGLGKGLLPCALGDADPRLVKIEREAKPFKRTLFIHTSYDMLEVRRVKSVISWLRESLNSGLCT